MAKSMPCVTCEAFGHDMHAGHGPASHDGHGPAVPGEEVFSKGVKLR